jgi:hypothetical protein
MSLWLGAVGLVGIAVMLPGLVDAAHAASEPTFDAVATAYGLDVTVANQDIPLGLTIEGAGPVAQAELTSLPQSTSFASLPYPGGTLVQLPGLVGALVPGTPALPAYPAYVSAALDSGPQSNDIPGVTLTAQSTPTNSQATAIGGTGSTGYSATASVELDSAGNVTAAGDATFSDLGLGQLVSISNVHSAASEILNNGSGQLTHTSSLTIGDISVPGLKLAIPKTTPTQVPVLGKLPPIPLPFGGMTIDAPELGFENGTFTVSLPLLGSGNYAVPFSVVATALKAVGITATFEQPIVKKQSIVSSALVLSTVLPSPPKNLPITGPVPVTVTIGRSTAAFSGHLLSAPESTGPATGGSLPATSAGSSSSGVGAGALPGLGAIPGDGAAPPELAGPPTQPGSDYLVSQGVNLPDTSDIYLVVVGAAIIGSIAAQALRVLGVRIRWNS